MQLHIAAIGAKPNPPEADLIAAYAKRTRDIGRNIGFSNLVINAFDAPRSLSGDKKTQKEAELLLSAAPTGARIIALDEKGKNMSSDALARIVGQWRDEGAPSAAFLIGGADGFHQSVREKANLLLSFGALTWPHMLVRVMLAEQLYRVMTILAGHPYHRA